MENSSTDTLILWRRLGQLLLRWTIVFTIAGALIYSLGLILGSVFSRGSPGMAVFWIPVLAGSLGIPLGQVQRRLLNPFLPVESAWAWQTAGGLALGLLAVMGLSVGIRGWVEGWTDGYRLTAFLTGAGISGVLAGLGQWIVLRKVVQTHQWWLLANAVGWLMAWLALLAVGLFLGRGEPLPATLERAGHAAILGAVAGFMIGFEQGVALVGLLAQRVWEDRRRKKYGGLRF